jgi:hypothetical protein
MKIHYDRFYRYVEFTELLHQFVKKFPTLLAIESIGESHEGKDIWVVTATNQQTGPAAEKTRVLGGREHSRQRTGRRGGGAVPDRHADQKPR